MHERPQAALFHALRELGYRITADRDHLPAEIRGEGPRAAACHISIEESSQFASALLLCAQAGGWKVNLAGEALEGRRLRRHDPRIDRQAFPHAGGTFQIEPDASSASYFLAADWLAGGLPGMSVNVAAFPHLELADRRRLPRNSFPCPNAFPAPATSATAS